MKKDHLKQLESIPIDDLLTHLAAGDVGALDQIFHRYYHRLLSYGLQLSGGNRQEDISDIVQEFFIWLAQNYDKVGKIRDFEAYIFQSIRRNIFLKLGLYREHQTLMGRFLNTVEEDNVLPSPEEVFIRIETKKTRQALITDELNKLPAHQWEVLYLRYYEGRSYKNIAEILSISDQVARNFAARGIKKLKAQLKDLAILIILFLI